MFRCPLCHREEADSADMKGHAERCNGAVPVLELPPFYSALTQSPAGNETSRYKATSYSSLKEAQSTPLIVKTPPLSFFSVAHQRLVHLERHHPDKNADPPTTRVQRARIRRLFSDGYPVEEINRCVNCSSHAVHAVLSRHVSGEDYDNVGSDDEYTSGDAQIPGAHDSALLPGKSHDSESNLVLSEEAGPSYDGDSLPMLEWPDSDEDLEGGTTAVESDNDSEDEIPLRALVAQRRFPCAENTLNRRATVDASGGGMQNTADSDSDEDIPLAAAKQLIPRLHVSLPRAVKNASDSEPDIPLSAATMARGTPRRFSLRSSLMVDQGATPSPSPSPATPRDRARSVGTPQIWTSPIVSLMTMDVEEEGGKFSGEVPCNVNEETLSEDGRMFMREHSLY
ncbi:hypothetical protein NM688_g4325 [Phlebia brevispora]|uniref:Uncharacterized protein n=1 Tax=Phlebia brevispora TaxID=194682 RepID=A0ACC1T3D2_9APHY|nr:hypothetical protein NM688_g4325 [Phlebia brevispora]